MTKANLTLSTIIILVTAMTAVAAPMMNYTSAPEPVRGIEALKQNTEYPKIPAPLREEGLVVVKFRVDVIGNVSDIQIAQSGGSLLDDRAIQAVRKTDWNPAMQNGRAIAVTYLLPLEFHSR
jgi:protein TonB